MLRFLLFLSVLIGSLSAFSQSRDDHNVAIDKARIYLKGNKSKFSLTDVEIDQLVVIKTGFSKKSGVTHIYFNQTYNSIKIYNAIINVHVDKSGKVVQMGDRSLNFKKSADGIASRSAITQEEAIEHAAREMGIVAIGRSMETQNSTLKSIPSYKESTIYENTSVSIEPFAVQLMYVLTNAGVMKLVWDFNLFPEGRSEKWNYHVDAVNGDIVNKISMVSECNFGHDHSNDINEEGAEKICNNTVEARAYEDGTDGASYNVFAAPLESPNFGSRTLVTNPADDIASPFGWHDTNGAAGPEFTITRGNNVYAYFDVVSPNGPDANSSPDGGALLNFDFPLDLTMAPSAYRPAAVTNLFYFSNIVHDWSHTHGFDEANSNFQTNNYGNGGVGGDPINAEAQDYSDVNNARYFHNGEGTSPRIEMYIWNPSNPDRDGDFDNGIIAHEYGHGVSLRLTGNGLSCVSGSESMGEGWSDYIGYMTTWVSGTDLTSSRGIGTYALNQAPNGLGIRTKKYSYDFAINNFTYDNIKTLIAPHGVGSVWATMLWDMTLLLIQEHGEALGLDISASIVMEGMKLQPCNPGFVDGRDAILLADDLLYGGENKCLIWDAFARRGLGVNAIQGNSSSKTDGTQNFETPASIVPSITPLGSVCMAFGILENRSGYPAGGVYSGPGVTDNGDGLTYDFDPMVAGAGTHLITYTIPADQCFPGGVATITVEVIPDFALECPGDINALCEGIINYDAPVLTGGCELLLEAFDNVTTPALPVGWSTTNDTGTPNPWITTTNLNNSPPNAIFVNNVGSVSVSSFISQAYPISATSALSFKLNYNTEPDYDGAVLDYSIDNGANWQDITSGGSFVTGAYNLTLTTLSNNPIEGRPAWSGSSSGFINVMVALNAGLAGNDIVFRWRMSSDGSETGTGVYIDDVQVSDILNNNPVMQTTGLASGSVFPVGTTTNTFSRLLFDGRTVTCSFDVIVPELIEAIATANPNPVCEGGTLNLDVTAGATYEWSGPDNFASILKNPSITNIQAAAAGIYFVTVSTGPGCSASTSVNVAINPTPSAIATPGTQTICSNTAISPIVLSGPVGGTTFDWTRNNTGTVTGIAGSGSGNISGTLVNTTNAPVTVTFTITPSADGCTGPAITSTVIVNPTPAVIITPSSQTICSGTAISPILLSGPVSGTSYDWIRNNTITVTGIAASGSGNISGTLVNTTNAPVTVTFTVTPSANGCNGPVTTSTIIVNPTPDAVATPTSQTICSGVSISPIILSGSVSGTTYTWTRTNTGTVTGIAASGSGNITGALVNTTGDPVSVSFTVTPSANGCAGIPVTSVVTVNPAPEVVAGPASQTICSGGMISPIIISSVTVGSTYSWTRDNTGSVTGIASSGSGNISGALVNTTNAPVLVTFTITATANGCTGPAITSTVLVGPLPVASAAPASQSICSGGNITPIVLNSDVIGSTFTWTRDNTATVTGIAASGSGNISGALVNTTNAPVTVTFTISSSAEGCPGPVITATVIVNPTPTVTATPGTQTICSNTAISAIVLTGTVSGAIYSWTRDNTATVTGIAASGSGNISGTLVNTTGAPITVTFTVTPSANGCTGTATTSTVIVNPAPVATATPVSQTVCTGGPIQPIVLSSNIGGTTFAWTRNNTATVTGIAASGSGNISGTLVNTTNAPVTVTFTVVPTANGCNGAPISVTVLVNPNITLTSTPASQSICSGAAITNIVLGGAIPGGIYTWTRNNTGSVTGIAASGTGNISGMLTNTTNAPVTVTFSITSNSGGCISNILTASVIVNPSPVGTISVSGAAGCVGSSIQLSAGGGVFYNWSGPQGWTSAEQNPSILLVSYLQAGKYFVTITNSNGCSVVMSTSFKVNYPPVATATYDVSTACSGSDLKLHATGAGSYSWTGPGGWTSTTKDPVISNVNATNSGTYTLTVTSPNGCTASRTINITINMPPALSANPVLTKTCVGSTIQLFATGSGSFEWTGPATYTSNMQNPVISNIPVHMSGMYTVKLTASTGCSSTSNVEVEVFDQIHAVATAAPQTVCEGQSLQLHAEGGSTYLWNGPNGFNSNDSDPRIDNITLAHSGKYYVFIYNEGGCFGYAEVDVSILPVVKSSAYATPNPVAEFSQVQLFASNTGTAYSWTGPLGYSSNEQNPVIKKVSRYMAGVYIVTITNENGCPSVVKVNLRVLYTNKNGSTIAGEEDQLETRTEKVSSVYPNPTNDILYFETDQNEAIEYLIYDVNGKLQTQQVTTTDRYISTKFLSSGVYQIRWKTQDSSEWTISKFVKIR